MKINKNYEFIPEFIKTYIRKSSHNRKRLIKNRSIVKKSEVERILNDAPFLSLDQSLNNQPKIAIIKAQEVLDVDGYVNPKASWLRYERFCKHNSIPYDFYDITKSDWLEQAKNFDIFVCHTDGDPYYQEMIESKIYVLEKILGKHCFPSYHEVWQYEDKIRAHYLYECYKIPAIPTYVTNNEQEAYSIIENIEYPFISKTKIGASSSGVKKINTIQEAKKDIKNIFSSKGARTQFLFQNQKNYYYIQKFIDDATYDLRIILVGDKAFGYYRYPDAGDYRASGSSNIEKKEIPFEALKLAVEVRNKLRSRQMGVDLLFSEKLNQYFVIETSLFNQIDTPEQLAINGVPGYYDVSDINNILFKEGKFWIQELVLRDVIKQWHDTKQLIHTN